MVKKHNVLIIASGAREHALGWKLKQSQKVDKIYFAPGTAGTEQIGVNTNISLSDFDGLIAFVQKNNIDFTVATQDDILALGVVNAFLEKGLIIFGATKEASQIESSKAFAKKLMVDEHIPTATYETFSDYTKAREYIVKHPFPLVIKASGLALGKGVVVANTIKEAEKALTDMLVNNKFGKAGDTVVVEEYLEGNEISMHVVSDGEKFIVFPPSRDHKPIFDKNLGPNTGGMGTIAPVPNISEQQIEEINKRIIVPLIKGMRQRGIPFKGLLYPGLMMTKQGPKVIEVNSRFGDPEAESYMRLLKSDLFEILYQSATGKLTDTPIEWLNQSACCIVLAAAGYPGEYKKGEIIYGIDRVEKEDKDIVVFHFATKRENGNLVTNGGRVLGVTAVGTTLPEALRKAYSVIGEKGIHFNGMQFRTDIGKSM